MAKQEVFEVLEVLPYQEDQYNAHLRLVCGCAVRVTVPRDRVFAFPRARRVGRGDTNVRGTFECPVGHPPHVRN